jgi:O-antigen/teichoic acid export membrane protein
MNASAKLRRHGQRLGNSRFVRNVAATATGIAAAQVISLAFVPFLTRLYGPEPFGALAAFSAVVSIITPLSTFGFANAIVMPATEEGATAVARLSLVCAALVAPLVMLFVWLFQPQLAKWTGLEASADFLYLIPFSLLLGALLSVANQVAIREGLFKAKAISHVASTLLVNIGKLIGGLLAPSGLVLIVIAMVGNALNYTMLLARVPRAGAFQVRRWFGTSGTLKAAKEQRDFALFRMPQSVINAASFGLPVILLTSLFGSSTAGQYSITTLVLGAPIMLLGQSVTEVFFPKVTETLRKQPAVAAPLLKRATIVMALLAIIPFGVIVAAGDVIFPFVLGSQWERAGQFSQWIAIWMASVLATRPAVAAMPVLRLQGALLIYEILITIGRVGALYLGAKIGDDLTAVRSFALVNVVGYVLLLGLVLGRVAVVSRGKTLA